ncbi:hypothetical protein [Roseovarius nubinhibens]|uniref:hypothetical protein n=1 Tax=Roseovarius nubinhibens TaxID=314263 RepID=UPI0018DC2228|nr:hypothetical protein [Roseovarius nubinhibens]
MRHTLMINLDEAHALQLDELRQHFKLSAEDTVRIAIRTAHAMHRKGSSAPECKPSAVRKPEASPL